MLGYLFYFSVSELVSRLFLSLAHSTYVCMDPKKWYVVSWLTFFGDPSVFFFISGVFHSILPWQRDWAMHASSLYFAWCAWGSRVWLYVRCVSITCSLGAVRAGIPVLSHEHFFNPPSSDVLASWCVCPFLLRIPPHHPHTLGLTEGGWGTGMGFGEWTSQSSCDS